MPDDLAAGLAKLGVKRMLLAIHDASFPADPDEDLGRGSPATNAAARLFTYLRGLGFTGIQLGPQGQTPRSNPSPYDGTIFSRHIGNISAATWRALVDNEAVEQALVHGTTGAQYKHAYDATHALLARAYEVLERGERPDLRARLDAFRVTEAGWLESDALHAAICESSGGAGFRSWDAQARDLWRAADPARVSALVTRHARAIDRYALGQLLVHEEHQRIRRACGLQLYGDMQIGYSDADAWRFSSVFLDDYLMGAPPSRTNPDGQPWGYPVLDPAQYGGAALALVNLRAEKAFAEYDSLRIDHPHGLVCPWVYRSDTGDPALAVRHGARLFESPDLPDHPALARFAIARPEQLRRDLPCYHDRWVADLDATQIDRYAILIDAIVDAAIRHGRSRADLSCEVLSTMPAPLEAMLRRHNLGRWRVTQKASMDDAADVYRSENAAREDWVMLGNHDTAPILSVIRGWTPVLRDKWARHLTALLHLQQPERLSDNAFFATAMLAELFVSRAENVSIFFADLFGYEERFNVPGLVDEANWTLRLSPNFEQRSGGLDLPLAIDLALAAQEQPA